jgi:hypothetical protein
MDVLIPETCLALNNEIKSKWHPVGLSLFNSNIKFHENPFVGSRVVFDILFFGLGVVFAQNEFKIKYTKSSETNLVIFVTYHLLNIKAPLD